MNFKRQDSNNKIIFNNPSQKNKFGYGFLSGVLCTFILFLGIFASQIFPLFFTIFILISGFILGRCAFLFGTQSSIIAVLTSFFLLALSHSLTFAIICCLFLFVPVILVCWLYGLRFYELSSDEEESSISYGQWFSFQKLILILILYFITLATILGFYLSRDLSIQISIKTIVSYLLSYFEKHQTLFDNQQSIDLLDLEIFLKNNFLSFAITCAGVYSFCCTLLSFYFSSQKFMPKNYDLRPAISWSDSFYLPSFAIGLFILILITVFFGPYSLNFFYFPAMGIFLTAFILSGIFYVHAKTRHFRFRFILLFLLYFTLFSGANLMLLFLLGIFASSPYSKKNNSLT